MRTTTDDVCRREAILAALAATVGLADPLEIAYAMWQAIYQTHRVTH